MPFIRRQEVDPKLLEASNKATKEQLRKALLNPGLNAEQRQRIKEEIALLGLGGRVYDPARPPRPGAISFDPV
jgi:hypothetical protein